MDDEEARKSLLHGKRTATTDNTAAAFTDLREPSTATKLIQLSFVMMVVIMVVISLIISIYRSAVHDGTYILLGLGLVGFLAVEVILILFVRNGDLPANKMWFLYFVGSCIIIECIFTNIELFR